MVYVQHTYTTKKTLNPISNARKSRSRSRARSLIEYLINALYMNHAKPRPAYTHARTITTLAFDDDDDDALNLIIFVAVCVGARCCSGIRRQSATTQK